MSLPKSGRPADAVLDDLERLRAGDVDWRHGRAFSLAYFAGDEVFDLAKNAYARFSSENALNTDAFPSLRQIQSDVVGMVAELVHGGESAAGFMTTGGTESLLMAVLAARERGRKERGIAAPEMVLPASAHAGFEKGAHYFGVKSVRVPVRDDFRADVDATAKAINANTVLVVGSAPQYPQGVVDPIEALAALAAQAGVSCHVDACMGGMTLPFLERLGEPIPRWDFRVPGVTSISIDLHKYGYTAKGASVILYRSKELRRYQTFVTQNWLGGIYGSSGVLGEPQATLVGFTGADGVDAFAVGQALAARGWVVDQQGPPPSLHATVNAVHERVLDDFIAELRAAVGAVRGSGEAGRTSAYGTVE